MARYGTHNNQDIKGYQELKDTVKRNICHYCRSQNIPVCRVAKAAGINRGYLYQMNKEEKRLPSNYTMLLIANFLKVNIWDLYTPIPDSYDILPE